jgi:DNA-binding transcriptional ArsR family regulator
VLSSRSFSPKQRRSELKEIPTSTRLLDKTQGRLRKDIMQGNARRKLTGGQQRVVAWLATPNRFKEPKTLGELTEEIGVTQSTVRRWRRRLNLDALAAEEARKEIFSYLPDVYHTVAERAMEGSYPHSRLFLEIANDHRHDLESSEP